jgi:hypothetical protein
MAGEIEYPTENEPSKEAIMRTTIDSYKTRTARLDLEGIDFDAFRDQPLSTGTLRTLRYMHDIEHHTVCYLRDLLLTPAHRDPDVTSFLACWGYEELWHGEAIATVLEAHGEVAGSSRVAALRLGRRWKDTMTVALHFGTASVLGDWFVAVHMAWGAVNEWATQAGYARLATLERHPMLSELLKRIMKQEGRHIDFYASEAERRLGASRRSRVATRFALKHLWQPVGAGVMPRSELRFLVDYLFGDPEGRAVAQRIDRHIDNLPGLRGLDLMAGAVTRYAGELAA